MQKHIRDAIGRARAKDGPLPHQNWWLTRPEPPAETSTGKGTRRDVSRDGRIRCRTCRDWKPLDEFYLQHSKVTGRKYHASHCDPCRKAKMVARRVGITVDEYRAVLAKSNGVCPICEQPIDKPNIDHCHASMQIRGVLCTRCNSGLGQFRDSPEILQRAARYLIGWRQ